MAAKTLLLGIGNVLMGDEGIGVYLVNYLKEHHPIPGIDFLDGGTGGFHLLDYFHQYERVILIDATLDGKPAGTLQILHPRFSSDYPPTLTAHDIGLKDLLDALYFLGNPPEIHLIAISIKDVQSGQMEISDNLQEAIPAIAEEIVNYLKTLDAKDN